MYHAPRRGNPADSLPPPRTNTYFQAGGEEILALKQTIRWIAETARATVALYRELTLSALQIVYARR